MLRCGVTGGRLVLTGKGECYRDNDNVESGGWCIIMLIRMMMIMMINCYDDVDNDDELYAGIK